MRTCDSENSQWGKCWVGKNYIWNRFELCYGLTCQLSILFIWLNSIDWVFVLVNWNVHIVSVFSISRTAQGSTNAPHLRFAYLYFCWMDKPVCKSLVLPNVCLSSLSRRGEVTGWLMFLSNSSLLEHVLKSLFHSNLKTHKILDKFSRIYWKLISFG